MPEKLCVKELIVLVKEKGSLGASGHHVWT